MNCPYCDDNIHPASKFCPKCGLPLKEDSTVQGNSGPYVSDDGGWNPWVVGGGAVGIVVIALAIGFMTARKDNVPTETVRREPAGSFGMAGRSGVGNLYNPMASSVMMQSPLQTASVGPVWTNIPTKWAWTPPAGAAMPQVMMPLADPLPPAQPLMAMNRVLAYRAPSVTVATPTTPPVPELAPVYYPPSAVVIPVESTFQDENAPPATAGPIGANGEAAFSWDPVQERWARNPDWRPRRANVRRGSAVFNSGAQLRGGSPVSNGGGAYYLTPDTAPIPAGVPGGPGTGGLDGVNTPPQ